MRTTTARTSWRCSGDGRHGRQQRYKEKDREKRGTKVRISTTFAIRNAETRKMATKRTNNKMKYAIVLESKPTRAYFRCSLGHLLLLLFLHRLFSSRHSRDRASRLAWPRPTGWPVAPASGIYRDKTGHTSDNRWSRPPCDSANRTDRFVPTDTTKKKNPD